MVRDHRQKSRRVCTTKGFRVENLAKDFGDASSKGCRCPTKCALFLASKKALLERV